MGLCLICQFCGSSIGTMGTTCSCEKDITEKTMNCRVSHILVDTFMMEVFGIRMLFEKWQKDEENLFVVLQFGQEFHAYQIDSERFEREKYNYTYQKDL